MMIWNNSQAYPYSTPRFGRIQKAYVFQGGTAQARRHHYGEVIQRTPWMMDSYEGVLNGQPALAVVTYSNHRDTDHLDFDGVISLIEEVQQNEPALAMNGPTPSQSPFQIVNLDADNEAS